MLTLVSEAGLVTVLILAGRERVGAEPQAAGPGHRPNATEIGSVDANAKQRAAAQAGAPKDAGAALPPAGRASYRVVKQYALREVRFGAWK